jgi:putative spermidine/putrescine transport system permease protein
VAAGVDGDQGLEASSGGGLAASPNALAGRRRQLSAFGWRRPWLRAAALLLPPLGWFVLIYLLALVALFISAFWAVDPFTTELVKHWNVGNFQRIFEESALRNIALRTIGIAAAVTVTDGLVALPIAYFMARVASPRMRTLLFVCVLVPLWASYLARVYSWRLILQGDGIFNWSLGKLGLPTVGVGYSVWAMWIVFSYIWLPFMILPVYAALERIPDSYLEASRDLGARGFRTTRAVILPLALPGIVAGSIFTFSLTLGDFITPQLVGGGEQFIGNVVYSSVGIANDVPFAAAYATVPVVVMAIYLTVARRLGAFEAL